MRFEPADYSELIVIFRVKPCSHDEDSYVTGQCIDCMTACVVCANCRTILAPCDCWNGGVSLE